jgi:hypothetical protein
MSAVGMEEGADKRGMDRYEELTCDGENPRTMLVVLLSDAPLMESDVAEETDGLIIDLGLVG